jgi:hypothetical protein
VKYSVFKVAFQPVAFIEDQFGLAIEFVMDVVANDETEVELGRFNSALSVPLAFMESIKIHIYEISCSGACDFVFNRVMAVARASALFYLGSNHVVVSASQ